MQRTAQRAKAFHATISPNSNSESSTLRGDTRCDEETMPGPRGPGGTAVADCGAWSCWAGWAAAGGAGARVGPDAWAGSRVVTEAGGAGLRDIRIYAQNVNELLTIYRKPS
jgi:hypothetical protein